MSFSKLKYKYGFKTKIKSETLFYGLSEKTVREISEKRREPKFILDFRLDAFSKFKKFKKEPNFANVEYAPLDYQKMAYFSQPNKKRLKNPLLLRNPRKYPACGTACLNSISFR